MIYCQCHAHACPVLQHFTSLRAEVYLCLYLWKKLHATWTWMYTWAFPYAKYTKISCCCGYVSVHKLNFIVWLNCHTTLVSSETIANRTDAYSSKKEKKFTGWKFCHYFLFKAKKQCECHNIVQVMCSSCENAVIRLAKNITWLLSVSFGLN